MHITARGNARQTLFHEPQDFEFFLAALARIKAARPFLLHAWCLMTNHLHLLVQILHAPLHENIGILLGQYAKHINARLGRSGHVFQGRFGGKLVSTDSYFQQAARYIHLNPVSAGMCSDPAAWPYSSHHQYIGPRPGATDTALLLSMFGSEDQQARSEYEAFIRAGMEQPALVTAYEAPPSPTPLPESDDIVLELDRPRLQLDLLLGEAALHTQVPKEALLGIAKVREIVKGRRLFMRRAYLAGYSFAEIAAYLMLSPSAVSRSLRER